MPANTRIFATFSAVFYASTAFADAPSSPSTDTEQVSEIAITNVVGGKVSAPCAWPSTVDISGCTGTLIHHRVVTTAAHCLTGRAARIKFTAGNDIAGSFTVNATSCRSGATGASGGSTGRDWGYCVLPEDPRIKMFPITPPLVGCEADRFLKPGNTAWVVGFGTTGSGKNDNGIKREVEVKINKVANGTVDIGDKAVGACHGDSGGPLYIKLTDGTHDWGWRVAGSTSGAGGNCDCACSTVYVDIRQHVKAIEENEDIDVTPCTDDTGKWAPGPDCKDFITDPSSGTGTYPMCSVPTTKEPIATCGEPPTSAAGAAGSSGSAGSSGAPASAAAGSGARSAAGSSGAGALAGSGGAVTGTAGSPGAVVGQTAAAGALAAAGAGSAIPVGVGVAAAAGATAVQPGSAGALGTRTSAVLAAGAAAVTVPIGAPAEPPDSGGCQAATIVGGTQSRAVWLFGVMLLALSGRSFRSRQRRGAVATRHA